MDHRNQKVTAIREIIDNSIKSFVDGFESRYENDVLLDSGVINQKKNNIFIRELGEEFMFYSAFVRSFDSSFGGLLERIGNSIAKLSYEVRFGIDSFILPQQEQHIRFLIGHYKDKNKPLVSDYSTFTCPQPKNIESYKQKHNTDNYFYDDETKSHYLIELKAGGDLDNKKAESEKNALLTEYFLLKNSLIGTNDNLEIKFATAYNKFGEGNQWKQFSVKTFFSDDELLIGKDYWNFVCKDEKGFEIVFEQYKDSSKYLKDALERIKALYF